MEEMFMAITGAAEPVARGFLEITAGNFERAIELFYENPDLVGAGITNESTTNTPRATNQRTATATASSSSSRARPSAGRQDASGVIHISDDEEEDDDDVGILENMNEFDDTDERAAALEAAAIAQEEADAEMAQRLQEEMYRDAGSGSGDVRAPIARTTETLIAPNSVWGAGDDSVETGFLNQMRARRPPPRGSGPFAQRIWGDGGSTSRAAAPTQNGAHARRLEDLFRPPYDLMARIPWDEAREVGKEKKRWIMVNLQDMNDFNCQMLNRDIWKDGAVRDLVSENFVFLQYDKDFPDSQEYLTFYFPNSGHENPDNYPHVSIVDPRTGEQVKVWSGRPFPSAREFHAEVAEFLDRYSLAANSKNPVAKVAARKQQAVDVDRMTEDEMLEMALKNSLAGASSQASGVATPTISDPDALTKLSEPAAAAEYAGDSSRPDGGSGSGSGIGGGGGGGGSGSGGSGSGGEEGGEQDAFAEISSANPHVEPANDPATTTRIQFRHPSGRIIRRFGLRDSVRRAYEWLKAEPLAGREGVVFELKKMPQGEDLIGSLDETIEQAGLKQGTVMIEFITEG